MFVKPAFLERNEHLHQQYGHLLEGIKHPSNSHDLNEMEQNKLAILMDNAVGAFCDELGIRMSYAEMSKVVKEASYTTNTNITTFVTTQFPMIYKIFPNMIARELVSLQPMTQPTMKVFYHDILRGTGDTSLSEDIHNQRDYANNEEYNPSSPETIKDIYLKITDANVSATIKKLKYVHTVESQQDIMAYHGLNVESQLTNALSAEIVREWDRTIIQDLLTYATGGSAVFDRAVPAGITYTDRKVWMEGLYEAMIDVDTAIFTKRFRKTNWIVLPPVLAGFIEKMHGFVADPVSVDQKIIKTGGRYFTGTLNNRWKVYVDPFFPTNKILMGYNNSSDWMDTSYVFCPYILSYFSPIFVDPNTFLKARAILSRAARFFAVKDLVGVVTVTGS